MQQPRLKVRIGRVSRRCALVRIGVRIPSHRAAIRSQTNRIESRTGDAELKFFIQKCLINVGANLHIVHALGVGVIDLEAKIAQHAILLHRRWLVGKLVAAGVVVHIVLPQVGVHRQQRIRTEQMRPKWRYIVGENLRALILPGSLLIVLVGILKPRAGQNQIRVQRVLYARVVIDAIKKVFIVAVRVHHFVLRCIEKSAGVDAIERGKVARVLRAARVIAVESCRSKGAVGQGSIALAVRIAQAGAGRRHRDDAGLIAILRRNDSVDHL